MASIIGLEGRLCNITVSYGDELHTVVGVMQAHQYNRNFEEWVFLIEIIEGEYKGQLTQRTINDIMLLQPEE